MFWKLRFYSAEDNREKIYLGRILFPLFMDKIKLMFTVCLLLQNIVLLEEALTRIKALYLFFPAVSPLILRSNWVTAVIASWLHFGSNSLRIKKFLHSFRRKEGRLFRNVPFNYESNVYVFSLHITFNCQYAWQ